MDQTSFPLNYYSLVTTMRQMFFFSTFGFKAFALPLYVKLYFYSLYINSAKLVIISRDLVQRNFKNYVVLRNILF